MVKKTSIDYMLYVVYIVYTNLPCELFERVDIPEEVATVRENTNNRDSLFRNKRFMLDEMVHQNTSKFAIFYIPYRRI